MPEASFHTDLGVARIAWNDAAVTRFWLPQPQAEAAAAGVAAVDIPPWVQAVIARVRRHFAGDLQDFSDVPLDWERVSEFQRAVYRQARLIRPGSVMSYGAIAQALALGPDAARAVGAALGANPWPLLVPCHRVVGANGKMTGFSAPGGIRTKARLLALEGAELPLG